VEETKGQAEAGFSNLKEVCNDSGIDQEEDKACGLTEVMEFLGIEIDSIKMEWRVTKERLVELNQELVNWRGKKSYNPC
jgi:hypothetical protein